MSVASEARRIAVKLFNADHPDKDYDEVPADVRKPYDDRAIDEILAHKKSMDR